MYYRILIASLFGLLGFAVNFLDIQLVDTEDFKINILVGLIFPMIISLAWGWRYGLISALFGGCQSMWWLWHSDGWGMFFSVPVFTIWIVWHGWWSEYRQKNMHYRWYETIFAVEVPIRIMITLGFFTIFRWLVSFNPPPWDASISWDFVSLSWVYLVTIKQIVSGYLLILLSYTIINIEIVQKLFGIKRRPAQREMNIIYLVATTVGLSLWILDSFFEFYFLNPAQKSYWEIAILDVDGHVLFMRFLLIVISLLSAALTAWFIRQRGFFQQRLEHLQETLKAIADINFLLADEENQENLITLICRELVSKFSYFSAWIILIDDQKKLITGAEFGVGEKFNLLLDQFSNDDFTNCAKKVLFESDILLIRTPLKECPDCPLSTTYNNRGAIGVRLVHAEKTYGILVVSTNIEYLENDEEIFLLKEIANIIANLVHSILLNEEKKKSEHALSFSEQRFSAMVQLAPMAIFLVRDHKYVFVNPRAVRLLGYSAMEELVGLNIYQTIPLEFHHLVDRWMNQSQNFDTKPAVEVQFIRLNGEKVWSILTTITVMMNDEPTLIIVGQDISQLKLAQEERETALREKEILLHELYHRTKNNMQVIQSLLAMRSSYMQDDQLKNLLMDVQDKIHSMALVHQKLYESRDLSKINLKDYTLELVDYLQNSLSIHADKINIETELDDIHVLIDIAIPYGLMLSELVSNAYKYAFPDGRSGNIWVKLFRKDNDLINIQVSDDGVGLSPDFNFQDSDSLGIEMIFGIVQHQLKGEISIDTKRGFSWDILFKDHLYDARV